MSEQVAPDNDADRRCRLRPSKFEICLSTLCDCPSSLNPDTSESRPCNNSPLWSNRRWPIADSPTFFLRKPTNRQSCAWLDQRQLRYRLCFFLLDKCPQLIHFNGLGISRQRSLIFYLLMIIINPVDDWLMIDRQQSADAPEIISFNIKSDGFFSYFFRVALFFLFGRKSFPAVAA